MLYLHLGIAITLCLSFLAANPKDHEVMHGQADVKVIKHLLQITTSDKAIIHWKEFSNARGEMIKFIQPTKDSAVLNRVMGGNPTTLYGQLEANGQVFLCNPNGVIVGKDAYIDVGAFVASTFDVLNGDFLEGVSLAFSGDSKAGVVNLGKIKTSSGDAILIGFQVENDGVIEAIGKAAAIACTKIVLKPRDTQRIFIAWPSDAPVKDSLDNPYRLAFNKAIEQDALHLKKDESGVFLTMDAPIATIAGTIRSESVMVLGDYVQIVNKAEIDASGQEGGEILIGGDFQGNNLRIPNAVQLFIDPKATIKADATENGSGGRIICWSDEITWCYGNLSAKGGPLGGDGGFVEVSGKSILDYQGIADLSAFNGKIGTLLLDPSDLTIMPGAGATAGGTFSGGNPNTFTPNATPSTIFANTIQTNLGLASVIISSGAAADGIAGNGDITIAGAIVMPLASGNLTFNAFRNLTLNQPITNNSSTGSITLNAGNTAVGSLGALTINATITHGNSLMMRNLTLTANNGITISGPISTFNTMTFNINQTGNAGITFLRSVLMSGPAGDLTVQSTGGNITINQALNPAADSVGVGSRNGTTWINAPNCDIILRGKDSVNTGYAQVGFDPSSTAVPAAAVTGPIRIDCNNLTVTGGDLSTNVSPAVVGHGALSTAGTAPINAAITINCGGQLTMTGSNNSLGYVRIGHGANQQQGGVALQGDITVMSIGNITMDVNGVAGQSFGCAIGHFPGSNTPAMPISLSGNIAVTTNGTLTVEALTTSNGSHTIIGHGTRNSATTIQGNIDIRCQNLSLITANNAIRNVFIGNTVLDGNGSIPPTPIANSITGNYNIRVTNDMLVSCGGQGSTIGYKRFGTANDDPVFTGDIELMVGNDLTIQALGTLASPTVVHFLTLGVFVSPPNGSVSDLFVGVGRDLTINSPAAGVVNRNVPLSIQSPNDLFLAVRRNLNGALPAGNLPANGQIASIGTTNDVAGATFIRSLGNIDARATQIGTGYGASIAGALMPTPVPPPAPMQRSIDVRATGDITFGVGFTTQTGDTFIQADTNFNAGDLWVVQGGNLTEIAGGALPTPIPIAQLGAVFQNASPAAAVILNGQGAFVVNTAQLTATIPALSTQFATLTSTTGNMTVNGADTLTTGATPPDLVLGVGVNNLQIVTTGGDVCLSGTGSDCLTPSSSTDSHHNIIVNQVVNTSGFIYMSANHDLTVNASPGASLTSSGAAGYITLTADNNGAGGATLLIQGNLTTSAANRPILLDAGFANTGASSIQQTGGVITTAGGTVTVQAGGNILISGNATSVTTSGGNFLATATTGNIQVDEDIITAGGNATFRTLARNISFLNSGSVTTQNGNVTMTAENNITISGDPTTILTTGGFIHTRAGNSTTVTRNILQMGPVANVTQDILMISGVDMRILGPNIISMTSPVTIVVDNAPPFDARANIGPGLFIMGSTINSGPGQPLKIFTALQQFGGANNQIAIGSLFNGVDPYGAPYFYPISPIFTDTPYEVWCVYFSDNPNFPYPGAGLGFPFTIFYKLCAAAIIPIGNLVVSEMLDELSDEWHQEWMYPYYPPFIWKFMIAYDTRLDTSISRENERYWLSSKRTQLIHSPRIYKTDEEFEAFRKKSGSATDVTLLQ